MSEPDYREGDRWLRELAEDANYPARTVDELRRVRGQLTTLVTLDNQIVNVTIVIAALLIILIAMLAVAFVRSSPWMMIIVSLNLAVERVRPICASIW